MHQAPRTEALIEAQPSRATALFRRASDTQRPRAKPERSAPLEEAKKRAREATSCRTDRHKPALVRLNRTNCTFGENWPDQEDFLPVLAVKPYRDFPDCLMPCDKLQSYRQMQS